jgi:hypothetical protein
MARTVEPTAATPPLGTARSHAAGRRHEAELTPQAWGTGGRS